MQSSNTCFGVTKRLLKYLVHNTISCALLQPEILGWVGKNIHFCLVKTSKKVEGKISICTSSIPQTICYLFRNLNQLQMKFSVKQKCWLLFTTVTINCCGLVCMHWKELWELLLCVFYDIAFSMIETNPCNYRNRLCK